MSHVAGTLALVRLILRRDRVRLSVWILALGLITVASAQAVADAYSTPAQIQAYGDTLGQSPVGIALAGPPIALDQIGGILVYETALTALLGVALMAIFLTVRHTRADEEEGRTEMLRSTVVGRYAPIAAVLLVMLAATTAVGALVGWAVAGAGAPAPGAVVYGAAVAAFGWVFAGVAAVTAQLAYHARGAVGMASGVLGVSYAIRAFGDIQENGVSWLSPMGWSQQVGAFGDNRWWPLALSLVATVLLLALAGFLVSRRDVGAGLLPSPPGPAYASGALRGPFTLALRLQRGSIVGWSVGLLLFGGVFGSMSQELQTLVESNPTLQQYFGAEGSAGLIDVFFGTALLLMSILAGAFAVSSTLRTRTEESAGRVELLVTTGLSRWQWLGGQMAVAAIGATAVLLAGGLGLGAAHGLVSGDLGQVGRFAALVLAYLPAALVLAGLAVLLVGWLPRFALASWVALAFCFVIAWLGDLLAPPAWVEDLSPFSHVPLVPTEDLAAAPLLVLAGLALVAGLLGFVGFRRRDIVA